MVWREHSEKSNTEIRANLEGSAPSIIKGRLMVCRGLIGNGEDRFTVLLL